MIELKLMYHAEHSWPGVYFHGDAEDLANEYNPPSAQDGNNWCAPDLVGSDTTELVEYVRVHGECGGLHTKSILIPDGVHDVSVYGTPARLFLWSERDSYYPTSRARGLVCLLTDEKALRDAQDKFDHRRSFL